MRILLLVVYYLPSTMSSAKLIHDLATEFLRLGHEPVVVAPDENILKDTEITSESGIKVLRVRTGKIKTASRLVRGFNEARLSNIIWEKGRRFFEENPCDLIVYYSPTIFFGSLVKGLKKHFACPSYLILRDIFPQWAVDAGVLSHGMVYKYFKLKERQNYDAADIIGVQSPANLRYFEENGLDKKYHLEVLFNWTALVEESIQPSAYRERLGLQGKVVFFYGGNIGVAQDMDNIIRLAKNLRGEKSAYFLLVGDGSEVPRLRTDIASKGLTNIAIHDAVGQREYLSMLSEFDVGLISLDCGLRTQNFPGKMLGYMYHSMPILASVNPGNDLKEILEGQQSGLVCMNGEDDLFAAYARRLVRDENYRRQLGKNSRTLLENSFSVSRAAGQILAHFSQEN
ncbi:MAG: glycosyltransferase family 4 protein [Deltaproteobacteria bacterium]|nr:glycosyltransferase family 4 protein [Deltaproteobacteria bacterium]